LQAEVQSPELSFFYYFSKEKLAKGKYKAILIAVRDANGALIAKRKRRQKMGRAELGWMQLVAVHGAKGVLLAKCTTGHRVQAGD